jgi:hypothetical protein
VKKFSAGVLAVPLAVSMLLTGCAGDSKPDAASSSTASPPPTTASTPSASPTATVNTKTDPNIPAAARAHTPAGAEAFVKYFIERWNVAWTVPRAGILSPLCQPTSKACAAYEKTAARLSKEGHRYDGNPVSIKYIGTLNATNPKKYDVLANLVQERRSEIDKAGKIVLTDKQEDFRVDFELLYTGQTWSAVTIKMIK